MSEGVALLEAREPSARYLALAEPALLQRFDHLSAASDCSTRIRRLILDLAVRGELVPQATDDEPASALLKRIAGERDRLSKAGRIKRSRESATATTVAHSLPAGWSLTTLRELCVVVTDGDHLPPPRAESGVPFLVIGDVRKGQVNLEAATRFVPRDYFGAIDWTRRPLAGDVLYTTVGSLGIAVLVSEQRDFCFQRHIALLRPGVPQLQRYLALALQSSTVLGQAIAGATGIAQKTISLATLRALFVPLAPLAEQHRIVARVEELMKLCDALEAKGRLADEQHARLTSTLFGLLAASESPQTLADQWQRIAGHFDLLLDRPEAIDALEQTILQLAVRGLLVPQDASDEPSRDMLARISTERSLVASAANGRWGRQTPPVGTDEQRFELPSSWTWARLDDLSIVIVDCPHSTPKFVQSGLLCIDTNSFKGGVLLPHKLRYVDEATYAERVVRLVPRSGDLVFAREGTVGESLIIPPDTKSCLGQRVMLFRLSTHVSNEFIRMTISSSDFLARLLELHKGIGAKHVNVGDMRAAIVPLPPLAEQHRIVARVDELRRLCVQLRERLAAARQTQTRLANALVAQATA